MKILIVEDDADLREIIVRSLEKERYIVAEAPDYKTALYKVRLRLRLYLIGYHVTRWKRA